MEWKEIDERMVARSIREPETLTWYDPKESPFRVDGLYWFQQEKRYQRFPEASIPMLEKAAPGVAYLCRHTTGGQIAFETDARRIAVAVRLNGRHGMDHFAATGECGMDCYLAYPGEDFHFEGVTRFPQSEEGYACEVVRGRGDEWKRVVLNLPLYMGVESLMIGLPKEARLAAPQPFSHAKPVVFYGTSITQGGCASRPGMLYTNILTRRMNRPIYNFGFSGSGKGEKEVAELVAQVKDPALFVMAYEANAGEGLYDTLDPFLDLYRRAHPDTPILLVSRMLVQRELHVKEEREKRDAKRAFQQACVEKRRSAGDRRIFFLDGRLLTPDGGDECSVDGDHPTDLGFWQIAQNLQPVIEKLMEE